MTATLNTYEELVDVFTKEDVNVKEPPLWKCVLLNDDLTPMNFVVDVIIDIFNKTKEESQAIMLSIHESGSGIVGVYPFSIAETKVEEVMRSARSVGYPLMAIYEEAN